MIRFLADLFRSFAMMMGISSPAPGEDEGRFVLIWLGVIVAVVTGSVLLFYAITRMFVP